MATSSAGQLRSGTTLGAATSMATAAATFTISQNMNPNTAVPGLELVRLVIPRANRALGRTMAAAPYSADQAVPLRLVMAHARVAHTTPATACAATTRQGDVSGCLALQARASSGVSGLKGGSSTPSFSLPQSRESSHGGITARVTVVSTKPRDYIRANPAARPRLMRRVSPAAAAANVRSKGQVRLAVQAPRHGADARPRQRGVPAPWGQ